MDGGMLFLSVLMVLIGRVSAALCPTEETALTLEDIQDAIHSIEFLLNEEADEGAIIPGTKYEATSIIKNADDDRSMMTLVANFNDTIILAFYGPLKYEAILKEEYDILSNAETITLHSKEMKVSNVLNSVYKVIKSDVKEVLSSFGEEKRFIITGYSIGGAMASLVALALDEELNGALWKNPRSFLITFGQPRVGDKRYSDVHDDVISTWRKFRFVYNKDPIVKIPPKMFGWMHHSRAVYLGHEKTTMKKVERKRSKIFNKTNVFNERGTTNQTTSTNITIEKIALSNSSSNQNEAVNFLPNEAALSSFPSNETTSSNPPSNQNAALTFLGNETESSHVATNQAVAFSYMANKTAPFNFSFNQNATLNENATLNYVANQSASSDFAANQTETLNFVANVPVPLNENVVIVPGKTTSENGTAAIDKGEEDMKGKTGSYVDSNETANVDNAVGGAGNVSTPRQGPSESSDKNNGGIGPDTKLMEVEDNGYIRSSEIGSGEEPSTLNNKIANKNGDMLDEVTDSQKEEGLASNKGQVIDVIDVFDGVEDDETEVIEDNEGKKKEKSTMKDNFIDDFEYGDSFLKDSVGDGVTGNSRFLQICHEKEDDVCTIKHENIIPSLLDHSLQKYAQHLLKGPGEYFTPKGKRKWSLEEAILASCEN